MPHRGFAATLGEFSSQRVARGCTRLLTACAPPVIWSAMTVRRLRGLRCQRPRPERTARRGGIKHHVAVLALALGSPHPAAHNLLTCATPRISIKRLTLVPGVVVLRSVQLAADVVSGPAIQIKNKERAPRCLLRHTVRRAALCERHAAWACGSSASAAWRGESERSEGHTAFLPGAPRRGLARAMADDVIDIDGDGAGAGAGAGGAACCTDASPAGRACRQLRAARRKRGEGPRAAARNGGRAGVRRAYSLL